MVSHGVVLTTLAAVIGLPGVVLLMLRSGVQRTPANGAADLSTNLPADDRPADDRPADVGLPADVDLPADGVMPSIDQVAVQLRRLYRQQRNGTAHGSEKWQCALSEAYDRWLNVACRHYGVVHHMDGLIGVDRDLERMRVEAALTGHGLRLPPR